MSGLPFPLERDWFELKDQRGHFIRNCQLVRLGAVKNFEEARSIIGLYRRPPRYILGEEHMQVFMQEYPAYGGSPVIFPGDPQEHESQECVRCLLPKGEVIWMPTKERFDENLLWATCSIYPRW